MATKQTPVVMLHGAFCGGWAMDGWAGMFREAGYEVHAPDLRHHGAHGTQRDLKALGTTSTKDYCRDIRDLIAGLPEKPILVGHSMGGLIAQMLASRGHAAALVLLAPSAPWGVLPSSWHEVASAFGVTLADRFWEKALFPVYEIASENALDKLDAKTRREIFGLFVPESGRAVFEIMHWPMDIGRTTMVPQHSVNVPVFCAVGSRDHVNPAETVRRIAKRYREHASFHEYRGMSHWLPSEPGWDQIALDAVDWLDLVLVPA